MPDLSIMTIHPDDMRAMRIKCALTQYQLANSAGVTLADVERWETAEFTKDDLDHPDLVEIKFRIWSVFRGYRY